MRGRETVGVALTALRRGHDEGRGGRVRRGRGGDGGEAGRGAAAEELHREALGSGRMDDAFEAGGLRHLGAAKPNLQPRPEACE